jgi:hypothetical protein
MKLAPAALVILLTLVAPQILHAQASEIPSAAPTAESGQSDAQRGRALIEQMIAALGGDAWMKRTTMTTEAHGSSFFRGAPNPYIIEFQEFHRFAASGQPEAERVGFLTPRGMILPGKKIDVVQIWKDGKGFEVTYKGKTELPKDQVEEFYRRRAHSIEEVVRSWINAPGVMIIAEGTTMVERRMADKVTVLSANNDAVTFELDANTHLPLRRTFQWRNQQFKDFDEDAEDYADYHTVQGLPTAMTITRYKNGDMVSQRFITKVTYNQPIDASMFDVEVLVKKK